MRGSIFGRLVEALRDYGDRLRHFSPNARLFLAAAALGGVNAGVSGLLFNLYVLSLGYDEAFLGQVLSLGLLAALPGAAAGGPLVDHWGGKRVMLGGTALVGGGATALLLSPSALALQLGWALVSMGGVLVYVAVSPFLARHSTPHERQYLFAVTAAVYVVSTAAGSGLGGALPGMLAGLTEGLSRSDVYRVSLFAGACFSGLGIPLLLLVRERTPASERLERPASPAAVPWRGAGEALRSRMITFGGALRDVAGRRGAAWIIAQFVVADGLIRFGGNVVVPYFNVFFVRHLGASEAWFGTLRVVERGIEVAAMLLVAPLAVRLGPVALIVATQLCSVPLLLGLGFSPTLGLASAAFLFRGTLMEMTVPVRDGFMMDVVPERYRATANATLLLLGYGIAFFGIRLGGALIARGQFGLAFGIAAGFYVVSALLYWRFFGARPEAARNRKLDLAALAG
ncbi:MAG TPA: MFS transporter [Chloroflexota bacterium]|jgi:MFS family permease|nr:MFS transporter [Chloroflexota bacterium]